MKLRLTSTPIRRFQHVIRFVIAILATLALTHIRHAEAASLRPLEGAGAVWDIAISPDSKVIASGGQAGTVILWDPVTMAPTKTLPALEAAGEDGGDNGAGGEAPPRGAEDPANEPPGAGDPGAGNGAMPGNVQNFVHALAFSPNGKVLAVGYNDGSITFWNQETGDVTNTGPVHRGSVHTIAFSPDGKWMASGANSSGDDLVKLWSMENGKVAWAIPNLNARVISVAFSPDSSLLACASVDGVVTLADVAAQQTTALTTPVEGGGNFAWSLFFSPDGNTLAGVTYDNEIKLWNTQTKQIKQVWQGSGKANDGITSIAYAPDGKLFAISNGHNTRGPLELRDAESGAITDSLSPEIQHGKLAFAPNGKFLVIGCRDGIDGTLSIWDLP